MFDKLHYAVAIFIACKGREPNSSEFNKLKQIANSSSSLSVLAKKIADSFGCSTLGSVVSNAYNILLQKPNDTQGKQYWISQRKAPYKTALDIIWVSVNKYPNHPNTRKLISKVENVIKRNSGRVTTSSRRTTTRRTTTRRTTTSQRHHSSCNPSSYINRPVYWAMLAYWACKGTRYIPKIEIYKDLKSIASRYRSPLAIIRAVAAKYGCGNYTQVINNFYDMALNKPGDAEGRHYWHMQAVRSALRRPCDLVYYIAKAAVCDYPDNKYTRNMLRLLSHFYKNYEKKLSSFSSEKKVNVNNRGAASQMSNDSIIGTIDQSVEQPIEQSTEQPIDQQVENVIGQQVNNPVERPIGLPINQPAAPSTTKQGIVIDNKTLLMAGAGLAALLLLINRD